MRAVCAARELPDSDAALAEAEDEARTMAAESVRHGSLNLGHHVVLADESASVLFTVTFGDVVSISNQKGESVGRR